MGKREEHGSDSSHQELTPPPPILILTNKEEMFLHFPQLRFKDPTVSFLNLRTGWALPPEYGQWEGNGKQALPGWPFCRA